MSRAYNLVPQPDAVVKTTVNSSIGSAVSLILQSNTVLIEVQAKNGDVFIKTSPTATTATDGFQMRVQEGTTRVYFVTPKSTLSIIGASASVEVTVIEYSAS